MIFTREEIPFCFLSASAKALRVARIFFGSLPAAMLACLTATFRLHDIFIGVLLGIVSALAVVRILVWRHPFSALFHRPPSSHPGAPPSGSSSAPRPAPLRPLSPRVLVAAQDLPRASDSNA